MDKKEKMIFFNEEWNIPSKKEEVKEEVKRLKPNPKPDGRRYKV